VIRWLLGLPSKRLEKADCGGGLYKLPEQAIDRDDDTGELLPVWAANQWDMWRSGRCGGHIGENNAVSCCPYCYEVTIAAHARFMAQAHSDRAARKRWARHVRKREAKARELGSCRCEVGLTAVEADAQAVRELGRYQF
jgi:hypothetical protein